MSVLAALGPAILMVIGLNPHEDEWSGEASWPSAQVFDGDPLYQPTGMGEEVLTLRCRTWPHVMGGLDTLETLKALMRGREVVPYIRIATHLAGEMQGDVAIRKLRHREARKAPDGVGRTHDVEIELVFVGDRWR